MKKLLLIFTSVLLSNSVLNAQGAFDKKQVLAQMELANKYFMDKWPDTGKTIVTNKERPSNIWTRGVYYEGLMALHEIYPKEAYYKYAYDWSEFHKWGFNGGNTTRNADNYCAAQTYIDLYNLAPDANKLKNTKANINMLLNTPQNNDWSWIDAIQMGMPVFAKMGVLEKDNRYFEKMYDMYMFSRNQHGDHGLFNPKDGLWWRDADFDPPYKEPNGEDCYWSRGNGWVIAALAKVLTIIPENAPHREQYVKDLKAMAKALVPIQRADGFWNVSLHDPTNFGEKEASGTSLFVYGIAYGINSGILDKKTYLPVVEKAWKALTAESLHKDGFLGFLQSTGKEPKDGQPLTYDKIPDFEDYGLGCFLLAGSEIYKMK
ncbi:Rhamnogalacturonyl hydrolase YesR [Flavobacterium glycines]|uniref:Glycosyl hydrolase family 88 n=1 Tax=Flavobacterium glycines TaxID=551990 RepID=A0A1B9DPW3_9FLAO|nr:glycoside hydrolase family 88 protein [Flavobacterium glycines]OCB71738.1 glycosyl hydrolase family 88 [Flavobacterium glycines]GEL10791.1 glycosyl hydrolase family 88 [Flavobacterium glycines]SDI54186.1 Rhamnogalacturonyl hydrolase YesR [Flavobacterium glycines]